MRFLPWFTEEYTSPLPPAELLRLVQATTAPSLNEGVPHESHETATFQGWVKPTGTFRFSRLRRSDGRHGRRSSDMTVVEGKATDLAGGSRLKLLYRPALLALFSLGFWLVFLSVAVAASLIAWLRNQPNDFASWGPAGLFVGTILFFTVLFWWEVSQARTLLTNLLHLQPTGPA